MIDPILFPDVTAAVCSLLADATAVPTGYRRPTTTSTPPGGPSIVVRRQGGTVADKVIDRATIVVEAWHTTYEDADDLAQLARAHLLAINNDQIDGTLIYGCVELGAPGWDPDPLSGSPRFTGTWTLNVRGSALVGS